MAATAHEPAPAPGMLHRLTSRNCRCGPRPDDARVPDVPPAVPAARTCVARLLYASRAMVRDSVYAEMERIRESAVRNNTALGVSTVLLHQSGWFVQWKEGPAQALRSLMARIACDPRHRSLQVVHASRGPRLLRGPWSMEIVQSGEPPGPMGERVALLRRLLERGWQEPLPSAWRRLATPWQQHAVEPSFYERVLVCAAQGEQAFALVGWLARATRQPLVRRRLAADRGLDVGTDYVDFDDGGRVRRVIAMARRGLAIPVTRALLPDYDQVVLLLADDAPLNAALLARIGAACADTHAHPRLLGVHHDPHVHATAAAAAQALGLDYDPVIAGEDPAACWSAVQPRLDAHHGLLDDVLPPSDPLARPGDGTARSGPAEAAVPAWSHHAA
ncbi:MAG: BLUF domain-containing protein [Comamonadaceae bacterium]|nr:MAG: BLUF domain-containing protein [Comamonadaceae bacterium]